jgi:hypothetical protein
VDGTSSGSCPLTGFGINGIASSSVVKTMACCYINIISQLYGLYSVIW